MNWDIFLNINTEEIDEKLEDFHHNRYEATSYEVLDRLLDSGYLFNDSILLDFGCGKGRVPIYINYKLGCHCVGLDFNEDLIEQANINKKNASSSVTFTCIEAEKYKITNEDCFYFFNPFSNAILASVLSNILASYYEHYRTIRLFFYYPEDDTLALLMRMDHLLCIDEIDCSDLFKKKNHRERIFVFEII